MNRSILTFLFVSIFSVQAMQQQSAHSSDIINITIHNQAILSEIEIKGGSGDQMVTLINWQQSVPHGTLITRNILPNQWPLHLKIRTTDHEKIILNSIALTLQKELVIQKDDPAWLSAGSTALINIYLNKGIKDCQIIATPKPLLKEQEKTFKEARRKMAVEEEEQEETQKTKRKKIIPPINVLTVLEIKPYSISNAIFTLIHEKNFKGIDELIKSVTNPIDIKELLNFLLNIAIFITDRIAFDIRESRSANYLTQTFIRSEKPSLKIKLQWLYLLLNEKKELKSMPAGKITLLKMESIIRILAELLEDLGHVKIPVSNGAFRDVKNSLATLFKFYYDHFTRLIDWPPTGYETAMRKAMKIE